MAKVKNRMKLKDVEMALGSPPLSVMNHNTCFKDAIEQFIRFQEGKGNTEQTILYYKRKLKKVVAFCGNKYGTFGTPDIETDYEVGKNLQICFMTEKAFDSDLRKYLADLGNSEQTIISAMRAYKAFYHYCVSLEWLPDKPIPIRDIPAPIKAIYNQNELTALLEKPDKANFIDYKIWVILNFVAGTGCRIGSAVGIKMKDLELDERSVILNIQKNREPKRVILVSNLIKILREYINAYRSEADSEDYLFCNQFGSYWSVNAASHAIAKYNTQHGVSKTSIHLLRHTYAANYFKTGGDIFNLQNQLGHKSLKMVKRYADTYGVPDEVEIEEHSLINTIKQKKGRSKLTIKK